MTLADIIVAVVFGAVIVAAWLYAPRFVHSLVERLLRVQLSNAADDPGRSLELRKRAITLERLANALIRLGLLTTAALLVIGAFGAWGVLAGLGLLLAALTVAGQPIVLDYLMGLLIIVEGEYYIGDWIAVGAVEGEVEEVGLRRTVIRDTTGTVHSVSNGEIRIVSNQTRVTATAEVVVPGVRPADVERVAAIMDRVGRELAADPAWSARVKQAPVFVGVTDFTDIGLDVKMRGLVQAADRWSAAGELRRRLSVAFVKEGVELNLRGVASAADDTDGSTAGT